MRQTIIGIAALFLTAAATFAHADTVTYVYSDPQGTPLAEADANGNITATFDYRPYGAQALGSAPNGPGYTGHVNDPDTGLVYMQARYYDPLIGRFLSSDPVGPSAGNLFKFNRYNYANGNPIANLDPDGRDTVGEQIAENAQAASDAGDHFATYGWAFAGIAWNAFGAESLSKVVDEGSSSTTGDKVGAVVEVAAALPPIKLLGEVANLGKEAANVARVARGPVFATTKEATKAAESMGFKRIKDTVSGQAVYKRGNDYITRDVTGHNGGAWKMADSVKSLASKETRAGTYSADLKKRIGD
jgi:RHS repeat-associated protein